MNSTDATPYPVNDRLLGAFSFDPTICQLLHLAGVPVWLIHAREAIRPAMNIYNIVQPTLPFDIKYADWNDGADTVAEPFVNLHYGCSGPDRHTSARCFGSAYHDAFSHLRSNNSPPVPSASVMPKVMSGVSGGRKEAEKKKKLFHPCKPKPLLSTLLLMTTQTRLSTGKESPHKSRKLLVSRVVVVLTFQMLYLSGKRPSELSTPTLDVSTPSSFCLAMPSLTH